MDEIKLLFSLIFILAAISAATAGSAGSARPSHLQPGAAAVELQLTEITETRRLEVVRPAENAFNFGETPGLHLKFTVAGLEADQQILSVSQPEKVIARDSTGTDLSQIEEGFSGEREYAELGMSFGDDSPAELTFHLGVPARAAEHFSVQAAFETVVYAGTEQAAFEVGDDWITPPAAHFGDEKVRLRFGAVEGFFGDSVGVTLEPAIARDFVEDVEVTIGGRTYESQMSTWDDDEIAYMFEDDLPEDAKNATVTLTLRVGLKRVPIRVNLMRQPLP